MLAAVWSGKGVTSVLWRWAKRKGRVEQREIRQEHRIAQLKRPEANAAQRHFQFHTSGRAYLRRSPGIAGARAGNFWPCSNRWSGSERHRAAGGKIGLGGYWNKTSRSWWSWCGSRPDNASSPGKTETRVIAGRKAISATAIRAVGAPGGYGGRAAPWSSPCRRGWREASRARTGTVVIEHWRPRTNTKGKVC